MTNEPSLDINEIRSKYDKLFNEKEDLANRKNSVGSQIKETISKVREHKNARSLANKKIKEVKVKRDEKHAKIKELGGDVKDLSDRKEKFKGQKRDKTKDPRFLKRQIEELKVKLETEALQFNQEKKVSKQIKDYQKLLDKMNAVDALFSESREKSSEVRTLRKEAQDFHNQIQKLAEESEKHHQEVISLSKKVDVLKLEEDKVAAEFKKKKNECYDISKLMKDKIGVVADQSKKRSIKKKENAKKREESMNKKLEQKSEEAEEKVKKGGVLTMQDLLALGAKEDKAESKKVESKRAESKRVESKKDERVSKK
jgi:uncharacterized coiled-coil DUF342 family protein